MNESEIIAVWDVLREFGFQPDEGVISDVRPRLSFDFGDFKLSASCVLGKRFNEVVLFTGHVITSRQFAEICFELPRRLKSTSLCAAFLAYYLNEAAAAREFPSVFEIDWLREGLQNKHLLPWEVNMAAYNARPRCVVQRDWLRLGIKSLKNILAAAPDDEAVYIEFDGEILKVRCQNELVAVPAEGNRWDQRYTIPAGKLRLLPSRFMRQTLEVSVHKGSFDLAGHQYDGVAPC